MVRLLHLPRRGEIFPVCRLCAMWCVYCNTYNSHLGNNTHRVIVRTAVDKLEWSDEQLSKKPREGRKRKTEEQTIEGRSGQTIKGDTPNSLISGYIHCKQ